MIKFDLNDKEEKSANDWMEKQIKKKKSPSTTIGGRFSYKFSPNSIAYGVTIIDNLLKEEKDISDYDCW
jgi:hypothetical protein